MAFNDLKKMKTKNDPFSNEFLSQFQNDNQEEEIDDEELNSINYQLDLLDNALDKLEEKNDNIHARLVQLLESNRQAREQFQQMQNILNSTEEKDQQ